MKHLKWLGLALGLCLGFALSFVRPADAARNGSGVYSLPNTGSIPNPVSTGNTITSAWANGTLTDIATELTNSLDRGGRGAMTAPLQLASGTVGAPALTFSAETTTGFYRAGSNDIRMTIAGTQRQRYTATTCTLAQDLVVVAASTSADGVNATATGSRYGGYFLGGPLDGTGLYAAGKDGGFGLQVYGGTVNAAGIDSTGYGTGAGIVARSSGGNGRGGTFTAAGTAEGVYGGGGTSSGTGVYGQGGTSGIGVIGVGGSGAQGGYFTAGTAATASVRSNAITANNGDISFAGVTNPNSDAGFSNTLAAANIPKAWGQVDMGAGGTAPGVVRGFNISTVECDAGDLKVTFATAMSAAGYACIAQLGNSFGTTVQCRTDLSASYILIQGAATLCAVGFANVDVNFLVFGLQ